MKPKTTLQKEIIRLSTTLPELTSAQRAYAFRHCFKHYGKRNAKGVITCTECGHAWKSGHSLADTICGCICPNCGTELESRTPERGCSPTASISPSSPPAKAAR